MRRLILLLSLLGVAGSARAGETPCRIVSLADATVEARVPRMLLGDLRCPIARSTDRIVLRRDAADAPPMLACGRVRVCRRTYEVVHQGDDEFLVEPQRLIRMPNGS